MQRDISVTEQPYEPHEADEAVKEGCRYLIENIRGDGWWSGWRARNLMEDHVAITGICYMALDQWQRVYPEKNSAVRERAFKNMRGWDLNVRGTSGALIWNLLFALDFNVYLISEKENVDKEFRIKRMNKILKKLRKAQGGNGVLRYPFTTAAVLVNAWYAKKAGASVPDGMVEDGVKAVRSTQTEKGYFSYQRKQHSTKHNAPKAAVRRLPETKHDRRYPQYLRCSSDHPYR